MTKCEHMEYPVKAIKTFLTMLLCLALSQLAYAGHSKHHAVHHAHPSKKSVVEAGFSSFTLFDYIQANCKKTCVDHQTLMDTTREAAAKFQVSQRMLIALVKVESNFNRLARNGKNGMSIGLTQVQVYWHRDKFRGKNYMDPHANIMAGAQIFGDCYQKSKSAIKAFACYNAGGDPAYVAKISKTLKEVAHLVDVDS